MRTTLTKFLSSQEILVVVERRSSSRILIFKIVVHHKIYSIQRLTLKKQRAFKVLWRAAVTSRTSTTRCYKGTCGRRGCSWFDFSFGGFGCRFIERGFILRVLVFRICLAECLEKFSLLGCDVTTNVCTHKAQRGEHNACANLDKKGSISPFGVWIALNMKHYITKI